MQIAYFINQYPKVSHSFIRREIQALERVGFEIQRIALRGWDSELVDAEDLKEREQTHYILEDGLFSLLAGAVVGGIKAPVKFFKAAILALKMGFHADRPWPFHLIYLAEAYQLSFLMRRRGVRHVHAHFGTNSAEVVMLAKVLGGPSYSFTVHGPEEFDKPEFIKLREKVSRAEFVVAISSFGRSQLYRWIADKDWNKVKVVHCGLDACFYEIEPTAIPIVPRIVCVGRLCEQKGQILLLEAVHVLLLNGIDIELVLAGDGELRPSFEKLIKQLGLEEKVSITGWISSHEVQQQILSARALVLPSFAEGLPVVLMEAMALRRPVITTAIAGIPELVTHGEHGWLCVAGDVQDLVEQLKHLLSTPHNVLQRMGDAAHIQALERHSIDTEIRKLAEYLGHAVQQRVSV